MQRALILVNGSVIESEHIQFEYALAAPATIIARSESAVLSDSMESTERNLILDALRVGNGNRRDAAERLGISQRTLRYKLARLREAGVDVPAA
jgi:two-component system response regulator FlrC